MLDHANDRRTLDRNDDFSDMSVCDHDLNGVVVPKVPGSNPE
jgi:hypothetical protein